MTATPVKFSRPSGIPTILVRLFRGSMLAVMLAATLPLTQPAMAQEQGTVKDTAKGTVTGRVIGDPAKGSLEGTTVMLLWFPANAQGKPEAGPIAKQLAGKNGSFTFRNVPIDPKAGYQLGTRVDGQLVGSRRFTFAAGVREQKVDIEIRGEVEKRAGLFIAQALYMMEPRIGKVWVTEVVHLQNESSNIVSTSDNPLVLPLPSTAEEFEMIRLEVRQGSHERIGAKVLVMGKFQPGPATIIFRYSVPAALGGITMEKSYALPALQVVVIAEQGSVQMTGGSLQPSPPRMIEKKLYDAWGAADLPPQAAISFSISGFPVAQWIYLTPLAVFFVLMAGVVLWFVHGRLGRAGSTG